MHADTTSMPSTSGRPSTSPSDGPASGARRSSITPLGPRGSAGIRGRAVAWYREAVAAMPDDADPIERGVRLERLARALWTDGHSLEAMDACEAAIAIMPATPPTAERARVLSGYGQLLMLMDQPDVAIEHCNAAIEMARAVGARQAEGHALNSLGLSLAMAGRCTGGDHRARGGAGYRARDG